MIITEIIPFDKKRDKVYIDGEFAFLLYKGEVRDFNLAENASISDNDYRQIMEEILPKRCKLRAMNLLQKKDYTTKQLTDKLSEGMYPQSIVTQAIEYVRSYRYLDDERYVRDYVTYHISSRSRNRIIQDLMGKGISKEFMLPILDEIYSEESDDTEIEQIRHLLVKKHYDPNNSDFKEKQKMMAFLMRRGFQMSDIRKVINAEEMDV